MIGSLFSYAASRVAGEAVDDIARKALWGSLAALMLLAAFVMSLILIFWWLEPVYGALPTIAGMTAGCAVIALIALSIPAIADWRKRKKKEEPLTVANTVAAVNDEAEAAVDYFGAAQVVASAFIFGLGAARTIRQR